jgi:hypothetical protein
MNSMHRDQFARPRASRLIRHFVATVFALISGSVCPPPARSATPPLDTWWASSGEIA